MTPSLLATELQNSIREFLKATFPMTSAGFRRPDGRTMVDDFLDYGEPLFRGPYVSLGLPFRKTAAGEALPFEHIQVGFRPYRHQARAFERLCATPPSSALVATGTGSGKTECFFLPILDYCAGNQQKGIKAIVVYPMNALATDQARRFAKEIFGQEATRGKVRVGLYTGDQESSPEKQMTEEGVIACKETLRAEPPDILLTNYKMLDFLLMRPRDQALWKHNDSGELRFLVVDELHTFDGAQGTDLACLIRRLRARLGGKQDIACVGTSATIGGESEKSRLLDYAAEVFATDFDDDALILEDRKSPAEFLEGIRPDPLDWPVRGMGRAMRPEIYDTEVDYLQRQAKLWFGDEAPALDDRNTDTAQKARHELAERLRHHPAVHELLETFSQVADIDVAVSDWQMRFRIDAQRAREVLDSLLALISAARVLDQQSGRSQPFVQVRVQLWLRELKRMTASVDLQPRLVFHDNLTGDDNPFTLPAAHCRECHLTGWASARPPDEPNLQGDLKKIYASWFGERPETIVMIPIEGDAPETDRKEIFKVCSGCRRLFGHSAETTCPDCHKQTLMPVWVPDLVTESRSGSGRSLKFRNDCPSCGARSGLSLLGAQAASLASVWIGKLFSSRYNDHHKLIAFSDSVQDAAHRAGFFGARTYTTTIRSALAEIIRERGEGMPLSEVAEEAPEYWRKRLGSEESFVGTFIAPNMTWLSGYDELRASPEGRLPTRSDLPDLVRKRLTWEVYQAFGLRSRIGRTLERTQIAAVGVDPSQLDVASERLHGRLSEELGQLRSLSESRVRQFLLGFLWRCRVTGAFYHPFLDRYIARGGKRYELFLEKHMPNYSKSVRAPALLTLRPMGAFSPMHQERSSWFYRWFCKVLAVDEDVMASAEYRQAMELLLAVLTREDLLIEKQVGDRSVWGLNPRHWILSTKVLELACDRCGNPVQVPGEDFGAWQDVPCMRAECEGHYRPGVDSSRHITLQRGMPRRLVAAEHTGLLDTDTRLAIEKSFIQGDKPWHVNLLSATPTLELGINIGDLSSVLLCSVPPRQANYLQRIGRAGRIDGNALALTVANGHPHDLYFHDDPLQMIAGEIEPPGVFLKATAVLERQLLAFCFDQWAASGVDAGAIPSQLGQVLNSVEAGRKEQFPNDFLDFVELNRDAILREFLGLFPQLPDEARQHLSGYLAAGNQSAGFELGWQLLNRLHELVKTRAGWSARIKSLATHIRRLENQPEDEARDDELDAVRAERTALQQLRRNTNALHTFNFFTDEGLLPNYAFPEEGVTLNSIILRRRSEREREETGEQRRYQRINFEIHRPAQSAISELAPLNRFYAAGRMVEIDQVDLSSSPPGDWRLCDRCHHMENLETEGDNHTTCPRCGSPQWSDSGQRQTLVKLRQVFATADDRESRIGDEKDQREPKFFTQQVLVDIDPETAGPAYRIADDLLPFGFEYLPQAKLREINFGESRAESHELAVAGEVDSRPGFQLCRHCGKVRRSGGQSRKSFEHAFDCKLRQADAVETDEDYFEALYLFRELASEAVRILLPMSEVGTSGERLRSLIAALNLGLRRHFRGQVDHLRVTHYSAPTGAGSARKQYLVLYDSVPGGTGYLKDLLSSSDRLKACLEKALEVLSHCRCREDPDKDGCYRCILAYRESRNMKEISASTAQDLLEKILGAWTRIENVESLENIEINALLESELEQRFLPAIDAAGSHIKVTPERVNGKPGAYITILPDEVSADDDKHSAMAWRVEPQVRLGPADGVAVGTDADFVLWPTRDRKGFMPVAVYMDGFQYHYDRCADDTLKRQSILDSGRFLVWSLGWHDLPGTGRELRNPAADLLNVGQSSQMADIFDRLAGVGEWERYRYYSNLIDQGPFDWLIRYLSGDAEKLRALENAALSRALGWLDPRFWNDRSARAAAMEEIPAICPPQKIDDLGLREQDSERVFGGILEARGVGDGLVRTIAGMTQHALRAAESGDLEPLRRSGSVLHALIDDHAALDERFESSWAGFWGAANLLQFVPEYCMVTSQGVSRGLYGPTFGIRRAGLEIVEDQAGWKDLAELSLFGDKVLACKDAGLPMPEVGVDIADENGEIVENLELAWADNKVGIFVEGSVDSENKLKKLGWTLFRDLSTESIDPIKQIFEEAGA